MKHKVLDVIDKSAGAYVLRLERKGLLFTPGQYIDLVDGNQVREYSIYSGQGEPHLDILIREVEGGRLSPKLRKSKGLEFEITKAKGDLIIPEEDMNKRFLFVATGTGISPFHSFAKSYPGLDYKLIHGIRTCDEAYDKQDFEEGRYSSCTTKDEHGDFIGRVTDYLNVCDFDARTIFYLCGNCLMIQEATDLLASKGHSYGNMRSESFF